MPRITIIKSIDMYINEPCPFNLEKRCKNKGTHLLKRNDLFILACDEHFKHYISLGQFTEIDKNTVNFREES